MRDTSFRKLSSAEMRAFLLRNCVGRIAFSLHDRIEIQPVSYTFADGWLLGRTSIGTKLSMLTRSPWCAFEVDEASGPLAWTSVIARGAFHLLDPEWGSPDVYARAVASVRSLVEDALTADDPVPHRNILFGICVSEMSGRTAVPRGEARRSAGDASNRSPRLRSGHSGL